MSKEGVFSVVMFLFSFLAIVSLFWMIGEILVMFLHLTIWKLLVGSILGMVVTFIAGYIFLDE